FARRRHQLLAGSRSGAAGGAHLRGPRDRQPLARGAAGAGCGGGRRRGGDGGRGRVDRGASVRGRLRAASLLDPVSLDVREEAHEAAPWSSTPLREQTVSRVVHRYGSVMTPPAGEE